MPDNPADAARTALRTHTYLSTINEREPDYEQKPNAWLEWHDAEYRPAYDAWNRAMDALAATGYDGSRHPFNFRPWCEEQLREEK